MEQQRDSTWPMLWATGCLLALLFFSLAPPLLWDDYWSSKPELSSRDAPPSSLLASAPSPDLYKFDEIDDDTFQSYLRATGAEVEIAAAEPSGYQPVEVADRIASKVVEPARLAPEEHKATPAGPSLTAAAPESKPATREPIHTALLPRWVRRLPTVVSDRRQPKTPKPSGGKAIHYRDTSEPAAKKPVAVKPVVPQPEPVDIWPEPTVLIEQLEGISNDGPAGRWADEVLRHIRALGPAAAANTDEAAAIVARLAALAPRARELADHTADKEAARRLRRTGFALQRRIDVWELAFAPGAPKIDQVIQIVLDPRRLAQSLSKIESLIGDSTAGKAWREFLMIGPLKEALALGSAPDEVQTRRLAWRVLNRLSKTPLTPEQEDFISSRAVTKLRNELLVWAAAPFSTADLLADVERYERSGLPSDAQRLAMECQYLSVSRNASRRMLASWIDYHYRNANFRLAVTEKLLNDLMPEQDLEYARVNDTVLGRHTYGESLMATEAAVRLQPDPEHIRMALEVTGDISSNTTSDAGLAQFHNKNDVYYTAKKQLQVSLEGISLWPSEVHVYNESRLRGINTSVDRIPLLNHVFEGVARSQLEQNKPEANREVRRKVAAKARKRIDAEVHKQFEGVVERLNRRLFEPLNSLTLDPQMIEAATTETQFAMRLRLAGDDQLGSHTPRPRAPSGSLASVQVHETVLNNGIDRLQLAGRTFTLPELADHISSKLSCPTPWETLPENEDVTITFARKDPVVIRCENGQAVVTLSIHRLRKSPRSWKDFQIRAYYRPVVEGRSAKLAREGVLSLTGKRLTLGSQIVLRGIFSHVLSKDAPLTLVNNEVINDDRLDDTKITQFEIEDGWIGIALGPKNVVAGRSEAKTR